MTERWADKVETRLTEHARKLVALDDVVTVPKRLAQVDRKLSGQIDRLTPSWSCYVVGALLSGRAVAARGTLTLGTYTTGGVPAAGLGLPDVPGRTGVDVHPFRIGSENWVFAWNETTDSLLIYNAIGAEIANATDISDADGWPATVWGVADSRLPFHRAAGLERVEEIRLESATDVDPDDADFWTVEVRRRNADKPNGERIGDRFSLATRRLRAAEEVVLYDGPPFDLADEDIMDLVVQETGSAAAIEGLVVWVKSTRRV